MNHEILPSSHPTMTEITENKAAAPCFHGSIIAFLSSRTARRTKSTPSIVSACRPKKYDSSHISAWPRLGIGTISRSASWHQYREIRSAICSSLSCISPLRDASAPSLSSRVHSSTFARSRSSRPSLNSASPSSLRPFSLARKWSFRIMNCMTFRYPETSMTSTEEGRYVFV